MWLMVPLPTPLGPSTVITGIFSVMVSCLFEKTNSPQRRKGRKGFFVALLSA
jgi:hypothetical protein